MEKAIHWFLDYLRNDQGRTENTLLAYKTDLFQFQRYLFEKFPQITEANNLTSEILDGFLDWLEAQTYRKATVARKWAVMRSFLGFLKKQAIILDHELGRNLQTEPIIRQPPRILTRTEIQQLLTAPAKLTSPIGLRDTALLAVMYETGLRVADIIQIRVEDIDLENRSLKSPWKKTHSLGKATEKIDYYLKEGRPHLARVPDEHALFLNQRGHGLTRQGLWLIVKRWSMEVGINHRISPHTLRYSLAQHLLDEGKKYRDVQTRLGLKSPNSVRIFQSSLRKAGEK